METEGYKEEVSGSVVKLHNEQKIRIDMNGPATSSFAIQISKLEFSIARLRLVEALAIRGKSNGGTRAILRHYLWLWDVVTPTPEGMYAHEIRANFETGIIDLTQFQHEQLFLQSPIVVWQSVVPLWLFRVKYSRGTDVVSIACVESFNVDRDLGLLPHRNHIRGCGRRVSHVYTRLA